MGLETNLLQQGHNSEQPTDHKAFSLLLLDGMADVSGNNDILRELGKFIGFSMTKHLVLSIFLMRRNANETLDRRRSGNL